MAITHLYSHNPKSEGAANIAGALNIKRIRHGENSKFKGGPKKVVINWGSSNLPPEVLKSKVINKPEAVGKCTNKLTFFQTVEGNVSIPPYTTDKEVALKWLTDHVVVARTILQGSGGEGLIIVDKRNVDNLVKAPLYTQYIPKVDEYRIHVVNGGITDVQRKALRKGWQDENPGKTPNFKVRNLENGFIYMREGVEAPDCVLDQAVAAVKAVGLDFGAVDVIYNQKYNKAYVLEVNCAPGVEGTSIENYKAAFEDMKL